MRPDRQQLLLAILAAPGIAEPAWRRWRHAADLDTLDHTALSLLPLLFDRRPDFLAGDPWRGRIEGLYRRAWYLNQRRLGAYAEGLAALASAGIEAMALDDLATLKLARLGLGVLPLEETAWLVREADLGRAAETLTRRGWRAHPRPTAPGTPAPARYARGDDGRLVLRTRLQALPCPTPDAPWDTASDDAIAAQAMRLPALAEHLAGVLPACVAPRGAGDWARFAATAALIDSATASLDWDRFVQHARTYRLAPLAALALAEIGRYVTLPAHLLASLAASPTTAAERRLAAACLRGGLCQDWALFKLARERGEQAGARPLFTFGHYLIQSRGGGSPLGTLRWAGAALQRRLSRARR